MSTNDTANDPFVNLTSDQARQFLLLDIARRFKGIDPEVDARIDAHAEQISGRQGIKFIPATSKSEPRVPMYMEGEPGVGKTAIPRSAAQEFCRIAGLNYVENPPDNYQFGPKDFYFVTVNLSGKNNTMDIGGLPSKGEMGGTQSQRSRASDACEWLLAETESRLRALGGFTKLNISSVDRFEKGGLEAVEVTVLGESDRVDAVLQTVIRQLSQESKKLGAGITLATDGQEPASDRLTLQVKKGATGARLAAYAPVGISADAEYVAEMLPNRRFAMAGKVRFSLFNFDDVANASESVRNVLLEVAQSNRYSGVMDIGNAFVTLSGNMGAEDNTNTQSEQSDAEVTRVFKVRVRDTPGAWARRMAVKYSESGDCLFSAFVHKYGHDDGVFRDSIGDGRTARGIPKPNSRSLENALAKVSPYFMMAKDAGISPTVFSDEIETMVKGTVGPNVSSRYRAFMQSMLTEAIPLADQLLKTGDVNKERVDKHLGSGARSSEQDFGFRFGAALADAYIDRIAFSDEARAGATDESSTRELIADSMDRLSTGLAMVEPATMNYALSRVMARMGGVERLGSDDGSTISLNPSVHLSMAEGFARSVSRNVWPDPKKAETDFLSIVAGTNFAGTPKAAKPVKNKPRP
ncbi:hypothetical protein CBP36_19660 (plasmid) [Acidovorax carolinensis]|uniref:Uncharacterized protein n=1 Tax=Acidovorax carolinensis TaxID=553814 RepID=A0A240UI52_9BURK|nr:hypothetical protein [Acidovorax carolinensis]ART57123.1 hypothetical protein CBP35_19615 [Acidovorax carolinensis]ART61184.1 hypothetical protein CBP36_19660 [Acidovorax carolinensis]